MKRALGLVALLASACHFDHSIPPGTVIECKRDDDCPPDHVCASVGQCRSALQPFAVTPTIAPSRGRAGQVFVIDLTTVEQPLALPQIRLMTPAGQLVATVSDVTQQSATAFEARWTATGTEPEGTLQVLADLELKGRSLHLVLLGSVVLDFTPPSLTAHTLAYQATADNALAKIGLSGRIRAMGGGTTMVLQAALSEPLLGLPEVKASSADGGTQLDFELMGVPTGNEYLFTLALPMDVAVPDGHFSVVLSARDLVGNAASLSAGSFDVLQAMPAAPAVNTPDAVRFSRAPFGTVDGGPGFWIEGAPGAAQGAGVLEVLAGTLPVALVDTDADGGFTRAAVNLDSDLTTVDVRFIDVAGNVSPKATVRDVSYYAAAGPDGGAVSASPFPVLWKTQGTAPLPTVLTPLAPGNPLRVKGALSQIDAAPRTYGEPRTLPVCRALTAGSTQVTDYRYPSSSVWFGSAAGVPSQQGYGWATDSGVPPARMGAALEVDAWRGAAVLFGGLGDGGPLADTWELVDQQWHLSDAVGPPPRVNAAMTFDPDRRMLVMFGGAGGTDGGGELGDTWLLIDGGWVSGPDAGPPARTSGLLFYDRARKRTVLAGGSSGGALVRDTWAFDGLSWQNLDAGYDGGGGASACFNNETGEAQLGLQVFNGTVWEWPGFPEPQSRIFPSAAWDEARHGIVLYGGLTWYVDCGCDCGIGYNYPALSDTWLWNGTAWRQLDGGLSGGPPSDAGLYGMQGPSMAFDKSQRRIVLFGGQQTIPPFQFSNQLWALQDDETWAPVVPDAGAALPAVSYAALRWSPPQAGLLLNGGFSGPIGGQTWLLKDGLVSTVGYGPPNNHHTLAWDPAIGAMVMRASTTSWELDSDGQWTAMSIANDSTESSQLLDVDEEHKRLLVWGSYNGAAMLETTAWEPFPSGSGDNAAVVFDPDRRVLAVLGGSDLNYGGTVFTRLYSGEASGPGAYVAATLPGLPVGTAVGRIALDAVAGGIGYDALQAHEGAEVRFNLEGYWSTLPSAPNTTPGSAMAPGRISLLLEGADLRRVTRAVPQRLDFVLRPQVGNGRAGFGKVTLQNVFVRFDLRLPASP
jgi:hypothetical protein